MAREWQHVNLRLSPETHYVLKKYCNGNYQVILRALAAKYAKRLLEKARLAGTGEDSQETREALLRQLEEELSNNEGN